MGGTSEIIQANPVVLMIPLGPMQSSSKVGIVEISGEYGKRVKNDPRDKLHDILTPICNSRVCVVPADLDSLPAIGWHKDLQKDEEKHAKQDKEAPQLQKIQQLSRPSAQVSDAVDAIPNVAENGAHAWEHMLIIL